MRKTMRRAALCAIFALPALGAATASAATTTGTLGPPNGAPISSSCPAGTSVTGMRVWVGSRNYVDAVAALCSDGSAGPVIGSNSFSSYSADSTCTAPVVGIYGRSGEVVDAAGVRCGTAGGNTNAALVGGAGGGPGGPFDCPAGSHLIGLQGTSADYFGLTELYSLTGVCTSSTGLALGCSPATVRVGTPTTCVATYTGSTHPTGTVTFATNASGTFSSTSCTLVLIGGNQARCSVTYTPNAIPPTQHKIYANYSGDLYNPPSHTSTIIVAHL